MKRVDEVGMFIKIRLRNVARNDDNYVIQTISRKQKGNGRPNSLEFEEAFQRIVMERFLHAAGL